MQFIGPDGDEYSNILNKFTLQINNLVNYFEVINVTFNHIVNK